MNAACRLRLRSSGTTRPIESDARLLWLDAISTSGSMLGIARPTNPECPTAFPIDFREFQQKRARLCASDEEQRDTLLRARGGAAKMFGEARSREIDRVYRAYYLD